MARCFFYFLACKVPSGSFFWVPLKGDSANMDPQKPFKGPSVEFHFFRGGFLGWDPGKNPDPLATYQQWGPETAKDAKEFGHLPPSLWGTSVFYFQVSEPFPLDAIVSMEASSIFFNLGRGNSETP